MGYYLIGNTHFTFGQSVTVIQLCQTPYMSHNEATKQAVRQAKNVFFKGSNFHIEEHTVTE